MVFVMPCHENLKKHEKLPSYCLKHATQRQRGSANSESMDGKDRQGARERKGHGMDGSCLGNRETGGIPLARLGFLERLRERDP